MRGCGRGYVEMDAMRGTVDVVVRVESKSRRRRSGGRVGKGGRSVEEDMRMDGW